MGGIATRATGPKSPDADGGGRRSKKPPSPTFFLAFTLLGTVLLVGCTEGPPAAGPKTAGERSAWRTEIASGVDAIQVLELQKPARRGDFSMSEPVIPQSIEERYSVFSVSGKSRWLGPEERLRVLNFLKDDQTFGESKVLPLILPADISHALGLHRAESRVFLLFDRRPESSKVILDKLPGQEPQEIVLNVGRKQEFLYILFQ